MQHLNNTHPKPVQQPVVGVSVCVCVVLVCVLYHENKKFQGLFPNLCLKGWMYNSAGTMGMNKFPSAFVMSSHSTINDICSGEAWCMIYFALSHSIIIAIKCLFCKTVSNKITTIHRKSVMLYGTEYVLNIYTEYAK